MPELPEVENLRRDLEDHVAGSRIVGFEYSGSALRRSNAAIHLAGQVEGRRFRRFHRRGKYILAELDGPTAMLIHLGMSGRMRLCGGSEPRQPHTHAVWRLEGGRELRFVDPRRFGVLRPFSWEQRDQLPELKKMGPEPLSKEFSPQVLKEALAGRNCDIKAALLDQTTVAGIGNIYASEALWEARIHPAASASSLRSAQVEQLHAAISAVLHRAVPARGTTFSDFEDLFGKTGGHQNDLKVFQREGEPCPRCGTRIIRMVQSGRSTFLCPACQPAPHGAKARIRKYLLATGVLMALAAFAGCSSRPGAAAGPPAETRPPQYWSDLSAREQSWISEVFERARVMASGAKTTRERVAWARDEISRKLFDGSGQGGTSGDLEKDRVRVMVRRGKAMLILRQGERLPHEGMVIVLIPVDSPRLEMKQNPEAAEGGFIRYQAAMAGRFDMKSWLSFPLSLHGDWVDDNGELRHAIIGEAEGEPRFVIPDLLPHLSYKAQSQRVVHGEQMDPLAAVHEDGVPVTATVWSLPGGKSAPLHAAADGEWTFTPSGPAWYAGMGRGALAGYGAGPCALAAGAIHALADANIGTGSAAVLLADRSTMQQSGNTGRAMVEQLLFEMMSSSSRDDSALGFLRAMSRSAIFVADDFSGEPGRGVTINPRQSAALRQQFRPLASLLERERIPFVVQNRMTWWSWTRWVQTLDVNAISLSIPVAGHERAQSVVNRNDFAAWVRALKAIIESEWSDE
ncbi:MAG: Formamidopyrimidine-DNA glycosylase [Myxococcota bacterium]|nr:Formamidopyrimidine-DNA glycosylase [Myxococcota bacterium]